MNRNITSAIVVTVILFISASYVYVNNNPIEINIQATIGNTQIPTTSTSLPTTTIPTTSTSSTTTTIPSTTTSSTTTTTIPSTTTSSTTTTIPTTTTTIEVSEKDDSVTIRNRDTMEQIRVSSDKLLEAINDQLKSF